MAFSQTFGPYLAGDNQGVAGSSPEWMPGRAAPLASSGAPVTLAGKVATGAVATVTFPPTENLPTNGFDTAPVNGRPCDDADVSVQSIGLQGSAEFLLWWFKNGRVPPLATVGGTGSPTSPGTRVLVDNLDFADDVRQGGRFGLGYNFAAIPGIGLDASYFFLSARQTDANFSSAGNPVLAQPFVDAASGKPDANVVAFPGVATGTVSVGARTGLSGAEVNFKNDLLCFDTPHLRALAGLRFLRLDDQVIAGEQFQVASDVPGFGGNKVRLQDEFRTVDSFYGGQLGLETDARLGRLTIDLRGKLAVGQMQQAAQVNGVTNVLKPDGSTTIFPTGLYAVQSNSGDQLRERLALIPEVDLAVGWQLTPHWKLYAGYSFLWASTVARAGDQIDPVVNVTQVRVKTPPGPLVGPARPALSFDGTDFWAQGLSFGLELKY
jgi:hypothetical protein